MPSVLILVDKVDLRNIQPPNADDGDAGKESRHTYPTGKKVHIVVSQRHRLTGASVSGAGVIRVPGIENGR